MIAVPNGKKVGRVNGVLTIIDEAVNDNRPVTERIKTFADALEECGRMAEDDEDIAEMLADYESNCDNIKTRSTLAYMRLCIIAAALNEGWKPKFEKGEYRYFPCFYLYTKEQYDELDDEEKGRCVLRSGNYTVSSFGFVYCSASFDASVSYTSFVSRLVFRTRELAAYAGRQFTEEWAEFVFRSKK